LVRKTDELIAKHLIKALDESELEAKGETGVKGALADFGREMGKLKKAVQENIDHLDEIEKSIREQFMDCTASSDEFRYALEELLAEATKIGKGIELEISAAQKSDGEAVFERILAESSAEIERFKYFIANDQGHFEFARLVGEQKAACEKIMKAKAEIDKINADAEELLESLEKITKDYANARADVSKGVFSRAARLLSKERFNDEVSSAMQAAKAG
jgi:DNA-binding ferritin-like protein